MTLDRSIAIVFFIVSVAYGYAAYTYPLLPFERNMSFLPNTFPMGLSVLGGLLSLLIIFSPKAKPDANGDVLGDIDVAKLREYKIGQALALIAAMILYALALRPIGFLASTTLFLICASWILGERKLHIMIVASVAGAGVIWFLVQETLGIYLRPLPWFMS